MFDASFYRTALPNRVKTECDATPKTVPVVRVRLAEGTTLDTCHVVHLDDKWFDVAYVRGHGYRFAAV